MVIGPLGQAYAGHESILVAEVDCTSTSGKSLCDEEGVEGFPTLRPGWELRAWSSNHLGVVLFLALALPCHRA